MTARVAALGVKELNHLFSFLGKPAHVKDDPFLTRHALFAVPVFPHSRHPYGPWNPLQPALSPLEVAKAFFLPRAVQVAHIAQHQSGEVCYRRLTRDQRLSGELAGNSGRDNSPVVDNWGVRSRAYSIGRKPVLRISKGSWFCRQSGLPDTSKTPTRALSR